MCNYTKKVIKRKSEGIMENNFLEIGSIELEKDDNGEIFKERVYNRFENIENKELHSFGEGPFCRFSIEKNGRIKVGFMLL